jgi:DNA-binding transcriptional MerR regulator
MPSSSGDGPGAVKLKIDELAQRSGTTSRNIRAYQGRGLIPPPRLEGRTGYYGEEHLRRLEIIQHLQERGFSLAAIEQTLEAWSRGGELGHLVGFHHMLTAPWIDEPAGTITPEDLLTRFPEAAEQPALIDQAVELGLIVPRPDGIYEVPSVTLIEAGTELVRAGIPLEQIYDLVKAIRADMAAIARRFVDLIASNLVEPIVEGQATPGQVEAVAESVERLRPIAMEVIRPFLAQEMRHATDARLTALGVRLPAEDD